MFSSLLAPVAMKTHQVPSKILFKKLLNKIRSQKSLWTIQSVSEDESEVITTANETESKAPTVESGAIAGEERTLSSGQEQGDSLQESHFVAHGPFLSCSKICSFLKTQRIKLIKRKKML